ncbi:MAG TPA: hypothetical protein VGQ36_14575 [Thermoanaerobaculia bacterium]|jgi:hypothetical protein|nr:hypothetical protein [Thermoanaerobaculia bacterium]
MVDDRWKDAPDDGRVEAAAKAALAQIDRSHPFRTRREVHRDSGGPEDAACAEMWCVTLHDVPTEIKHCLAVWDTPPTMTKKFADSFLKHLPPA